MDTFVIAARVTYPNYSWEGGKRRKEEIFILVWNKYVHRTYTMDIVHTSN